MLIYDYIMPSTLFNYAFPTLYVSRHDALYEGYVPNRLEALFVGT